MSQAAAIPNVGIRATRAISPDDLVFSKRQREILQIATVLVVLSSPLWLWALFFSGPYEYAGALVMVPIIWLINLGLIGRVTRRQPSLRRLMMISFALKVACTGGYTALLYVYYGNGGDATTYFDVGKKWAAFFSAHGNFPIRGEVWGTSFINSATGLLVYTLGSSFPTISLLYAAAGFWGIYFFFGAFPEAFPNGRREFAALLLFLLPSCHFWTASIGKDSLMMLSIGLASYGFAKLMMSRVLRGFTYLVPAMFLASLTRPHVAGMVAIAMLFPYTFAKGQHGLMAALSKILGIPLMAGGITYLVINATRILRVDSPTGGLERIEKFGTSTMHGGSAFGQGQSTIAKLLLSPFLMFRPFPWEIPNPLAVAASLEALLILYFLWRVRHELSYQLFHWRAHPFFMYTVSFGVIYCVVFSLALSNLGLLIRQRIQYTPLLLMLVASATLLPRPARQ
jgi:hypothetical protein